MIKYLEVIIDRPAVYLGLSLCGSGSGGDSLSRGLRTTCTAAPENHKCTFSFFYQALSELVLSLTSHHLNIFIEIADRFVQQFFMQGALICHG